MAHYGTEYPFQSKVVQEQMKATNRQRYGVETPRERGIRSSQSHTWT